MSRRQIARQEWIKTETLEAQERVTAARPRPYKGPYLPGDWVLVYRRSKQRGQDKSHGGIHSGTWLGPAQVLAHEYDSLRHDSAKIVPRLVYVALHGRIFLCAPEQLRPIGRDAQFLRRQLETFQREGKVDVVDDKELLSVLQTQRYINTLDISQELPEDSDFVNPNLNLDRDVDMQIPFGTEDFRSG